MIVILIFVLRSFSLDVAEIGVIAAILGGLISGGLTLIGVSATLENQDREKFIDLYPKRKMILDGQLERMIDILGLIEKVSYKSNLKFYDDFETDYNKEYEKFYVFVEKSTVISGHVYSVTKEFRKTLDEIRKCIGPTLLSVEQSRFGTSVIADENEDFLIHFKKMEKYYQEINEQMESLDNKYARLTGFKND